MVSNSTMPRPQAWDEGSSNLNNSFVLSVKLSGIDGNRVRVCTSIFIIVIYSILSFICYLFILVILYSEFCRIKNFLN